MIHNKWMLKPTPPSRRMRSKRIRIRAMGNQCPARSRAKRSGS
jgi:hypothetical protein